MDRVNEAIDHSNSCSCHSLQKYEYDYLSFLLNVSPLFSLSSFNIPGVRLSDITSLFFVNWAVISPALISELLPTL